jgi:acetyl esterase/lipase
MTYFHRHFLGNPRPKELDDDFRVSPILAKNFAGLAPALVITAEMDLLRDEGEAYAKKMNEAGSKAEIYRLKGACHFTPLLDDICESGREYNRLVIRAMREALKM